MNSTLTGQLAAVTGAGNGIGRAIAKAFLENGAEILAIDHNAAALEDLREQHPGRVTAAPLDITNYETLQELAADHSVDHLVCSAAVGSGVAGFPFWNLHPEDWSRVLDVTLLGTVKTIHAFTPSLLGGETKRKSVLLIGSVAGQIGSQTDPPYSAAKAALINFAQCAAKDFASYGIRVNVLSPGMVKTDLNRAVFESFHNKSDVSYDSWAQEKISSIAPLGRWQEPGEFGAMAVFLASECGKNITGQTINIDGGQVMHS